MRVLVTGAYGLIGSACSRGCIATVMRSRRRPRHQAAARRAPYARWIEADSRS